MVKVSIKYADVSDIDDVYSIANDQDVRAHSFNQNPIQYQDHVDWFNKKLNDPCCVFLIAKNLDNNEIIGYIRYSNTSSDEIWEISIAVSKAYRGKGLGSVLIRKSQIIFKEHHLDANIIAWVSDFNNASKRSFEKAGYDCTGEKIKNETRFLRYQYQINGDI